MSQAASFPVAELDRRFYAFVLDRAIAWTLAALVGVLVHVLAGDWLVPVLAAVAADVVLGLAFAIAEGASGRTPGKAAVSLRTVHVGTGGAIGAGCALVRALILGVATLPTIGLGLATLAWTAVMDAGHRRRGWHDHVAKSIVVDVRPAPPQEAAAEPALRHVVNLTAMRLVPATLSPPAGAPSVPAAGSRTPPPGHTPVSPTSGPGTAGPRPAAPPVAATPPVTPVAATPVAAAPPVTPAAAAPPVVAVPAPAAPTQQPPTRAAVPPTPSADEDDKTQVRHSPGAGWQVWFDTGEHVVVHGPVLIGRRPQPHPGERVFREVSLPSADMSVSKTHALVYVANDGALVVVDRGSTNGSVLVRGGVNKPLVAGRGATLVSGDRVRFGDREMTVTRQQG